ncbi:putative polysaccharide biosynthesis protein [Hominifimenecus sp. rT4P-3]|uniref:putative polysaccharide biosynthesis protein n=1 Tax=Hominifimenecus sp. rT4P-3 TaxID=3242979 RepID=UPI003DA4CFAE
MKRQAHPIITGTLILTATGFLSRILGFFYRIYLSNLIGAEGMGIYQLISPVSGVCFALCCGPIQTAISRFVAQSLATNHLKDGRSQFTAGLFLSETIAFLLAGLIYWKASFFAAVLLGEPRTADLLRLLALSLPITAAHSAINGYYYGKQKTEVPSLSQLAEQLVRVGAVYLIANHYLGQGQTLTVTIAALGLIVGELASLIVSVLAIRITFFYENRMYESVAPVSSLPISEAFRNILLLATPLAANRLILGVLQSVEAIQIPNRLQMSGLSPSNALSIYGILTGMSLPFILFPSALTNSVAVMLLPSVAEAQSVSDTGKIGRTTELSIGYSIYLGILCTGIFVAWGEEMGTLLFQNADAGTYITILGWLCPFLYLATTAGSILNGMGKTAATFLQNLVGLSVRLVFVFLWIPQYGILAYLWGMLASQLLVAALHIFTLYRLIPFSFSTFYRVLRPMAAIAIAVRLTKYLIPLSGLPGLVIGCGAICVFYLLFLLATKWAR